MTNPADNVLQTNTHTHTHTTNYINQQIISFNDDHVCKRVCADVEETIRKQEEVNYNALVFRKAVRECLCVCV